MKAKRPYPICNFPDTNEYMIQINGADYAYTKNTSVTLGEHCEKFLSHQIEAKLEAPHHSLTEGEQSDPFDYSLRGILDELESKG